MPQSTLTHTHTHGDSCSTINLSYFIVLRPKNWSNNTLACPMLHCLCWSFQVPDCMCVCLVHVSPISIYMYLHIYCIVCDIYFCWIYDAAIASMLPSFEVPMCWKETANASDVSKQYRERGREKWAAWDKSRVQMKRWEMLGRKERRELSAKMWTMPK